MREWRLDIEHRLASSDLDAATESEVVEELAQHLEDRYAELRSRGVAEGEAVRVVLAELDEGGAGLGARVASRRRRGVRAVIGAGGGGVFSGGVAGDVRYAFRSLRASPGYAAVVILTLALGIGAVAAAQAVIDPLLLRPLGFHEPERLVTLDAGLLPGEYEIIRERVTSFERASLYNHDRSYGLSGDGDPERIPGAAITPEFFTTLGVAPALGSAPDAVTGDAAETVTLSYELWQRRFGGDVSVIGRTVRIDGRPVPVTAVMPRGFSYPSRAQLWLAKALDPTDTGALWGVGGFRLVARLGAGVGGAGAESQIRALSAALSEANPFWTPTADYRAQVRVVALHEALVGDVRHGLLLLGGAVALLLLLACANVANLVLARGLGRARELAVRTALGASGGRIVRQLLTETLVLAIAGGIAGIALAVGAVDVLRNALPPDLPRLTEVGIDLRVLAASMAVTFATGLLLGVLPARRATRFDLQSSLRDGGRAVGERSGRRLSSGLVVAQVALALLLVTGAGLLTRSLLSLQGVDTGIGRMDIVSARVDLPAAQYGTAAQRRAFFDELLLRVGALPGVQAVGATSQLPFSGHLQLSAMAVEHVTTNPNDLPMFVHRRVSPDVFGVLGIPLRRGRLFTAADADEGAAVALVDEAAAREFWPGEDPIGRRLGRPWMNELLVVVGVVGSVLDGELAGQAERTVYTPFAKEPPGSAFLVVSSATGMRVAPALRSTLREVDATVPLSNVATVNSLVATTLAAQRLSAALLAAFGILALALAAVGIYGVMAYGVGQRGRELALRLALGAPAGGVLRMVLAEGMHLAAVGAAAGIAAALLLARLLRGVLYGIEPHDPATIAGVTAVVLATAALAVLIPARRAARLEPMRALRE